MAVDLTSLPWRALDRGGDQRIHPAILNSKGQVVAILKVGGDEVVQLIVQAVNAQQARG